MPSWDPWYRAPDGWETTQPGAVLRIRQHAYNTTPFAVRNVADTFQVLFRSTDSQKNATWGVTTVFIPIQPRCNITTTASTNSSSNNNTSSSGPSSSGSSNSGSSNCTQPILSYQLPYDTSCLDASPSFGLQWGEPYGEIAVALSRGWWVSVPDYEGPLASYGANIVGGYITIDSVRAVLSIANASHYNLSLQNSPRVALWGYSNGASATEAAVELAAEYAPALQIAGAAIGGLSPNVAAAGPQLSQTQVAGLLVQGLIGVTSQYPEQRKYLVSRLNPSGPYNATEFFWASYMSGWQSLLYFCYVDIFSYFIGGRADLEDQRILDMFVREGTLGKFGLPRARLFLYHAVGDDMTPIADTDALVDQLCGRGANILYHRNQWGGHNDELTNGRQRALDFLGDVLDGTDIMSAPATGCQTVDLTIMQDPGKPIA
ncbi:secretory lipase-domain-containing protein [Podospora didyma]|uniref:Secretory lipase-domain-containing protein n=1 Tax=Podospora didyma TaxID=330526 RepID=A0AAE0K6L0_9PEZI|nr:secretory lipase-domain-containing protein [Podospora didyma]